MFQNINENILNRDNASNTSQEDTKKPGKELIFSNVFSKKYIAIYIMSFMVSFIGLTKEVSPFSISLLGACFANSVPVAGIVIASLIGNFIKFGQGGAISYVLTVLVILITFFIFKPKYNEAERNEKIKIGKNVWIATALVQIAKFAIAGFTLYDILASITFAIIAFVFYKIFVNSICVLQDFREKKAFSIEEVIGTSLLLAIAVSAFGDLQVLGFGLRNILSILIVMILGWKNGVLIGTTSGVTIGVTLGVITGSEPIMIAAYAISGLIAGALNRFGKIGVIVGFGLGNVVLAYVSNGYTVELIHFKEILIASIGLLAVPKNIHIDIEEFIGKSKMLPVFPQRALNRSREVAENLNTVSVAISNMANTYKEGEDLSFDDDTGKEKNKQIFITELLDNLEPYKDNMLYEDIANVNGEIIDEIFSVLVDKQEIERHGLLEIFAKCNSYIIGFDDTDVSLYLEENISQMLRAINSSYKISKSNFVWMKKMEENKKNIKSQLTGVSKAILGMAQTIEKSAEKEEEYESKSLQIMELLKQKGILVCEVTIKKENRFLIEVYLDENQKTIENAKIEKILSGVLEEKIVLNKEAGIGNRLSYISDDTYAMAFAFSGSKKSKSEESGDSILNVRLKDGNYLVAISDGMGSGKEAKESSTHALKLLENLLLSGFDKEASIELINSTLINQNEELFASLDIAIVDLYAGKVEFIKSGACPTYIKNKKKVQMIKSNSLPTGIVQNSTLETFDKDVANGDIIVMCSDGIIDSNVEYKNKELWLKYLLEDIETDNTKKIADLVLNEAVDNNFGTPKDDMTVLACRFVKK